MQTQREGASWARSVLCVEVFPNVEMTTIDFSLYFFILYNEPTNTQLIDKL
jgi:hypothetical protein